jgi:hypothetical protein
MYFILKTVHFRFGFLILKKENRIPGNHTWVLVRIGSRSTPEVGRPSRDQRLHTQGWGRSRTPRVNPSRLYHLILI